MSGPDRQAPRKAASSRARNVIRGLLLLGIGKQEGFACFDGGRDAFLAGLAPQIGFLVVASALLLSQHPTAATLCLLVLLLCAVLLPPVISQAMAQLWKRDERWLRYATASAWSVWLILPAYLPAMLAASILLGLGINRVVVSEAMMLLLTGYVLWLQWFMAWRGLAISRLKAVATVLALAIGSSLLVAMLQPLMVQLMPDVIPASTGTATPAH